ncbi:hypothetical protein, partial [Caldisphaera sp.]|uniref:hypothetical protein n=1 Tax=Caldisphaera sp. TaxID=2060322 RepID=UPI003D116F9A
SFSTIIKFTYKVYKLHGLSETVDDGFNEIFREELIRQGVVCNLVGEGRVLKITPPVLIDDDDFEFGTRAIEKTILKFNK